MAEKQKQGPKTKPFYDRLLAVQSTLEAPKGQVNTFGGYKYRSCEDILTALKPLLTEHEMVLTISDDLIEIEGRYYIKATACVSDGAACVQTTAFAREAETKKGMDVAQITGSASSYARKYALNGLFCIDDTKDADTQDNTEAVTAKANPDYITTAQRKELADVAKDSGWSSADVKEYLEAVYSIAGSKYIKVEDFDVIKQTLKTGR